MSDQSNQQRRTAARKFMQSLGQLEAALQLGEAVAPSVPEKAAAPDPPSAPQAEQTASQSWETALAEAAADIEQYMNTHDPFR